MSVNRRQFLAAAPCTAIAALVPAAETRTVFDTATMTMDECRRARVWLDGVELTCDQGNPKRRTVFYADTGRGVVRCYKERPDGSKFRDLDTNALAIEEIHGDVVVRISA